MAAVLPFIAAGAAAVSAGGAIYSGVAQSQADSFNATVAQNNSLAASQMASLQADEQQRQAALAMGATKAGYGAAGVTNDGTPIDVLAFSASNAEEARQIILWKGSLQTAGYNSMSQLDASAGDNALVGGVGKASDILTSAAATAYARSNPSPGGNAAGSSTGNLG